jgi:hypothetical protein
MLQACVFMKFFIVWGWIFLFVPFIGDAQTENLKPSELLEDIEYLQDALYQIHPSPFRYSPKDSLDAYFENLRADVNKGLSKLAFQRRVSAIFTKVGCIHTTAGYKPEKVKKGQTIQKPKILPFEFFTDGKDLWTAKTTRDTFSEFEWQQVLRIEDNDADTILESLMGFHAADGFNTTFMERLLSRGANFSKLYRSYFRPDSLVQYVLENEKGDTIQAFIENFELENKPPHKVGKGHGKKWDKIVENHYFKEEQDQAVLKITSFNPYNRKTKRFYREIFRLVEEKKIPNFVIDLRDNLGGSINDANKILKHIMDEDFVILLERKKAPTFKYSSCSSKFSFIMFSLKRSLEWRKKYSKNGFKIAEFKTKVKRKNNFDGQVYILTNGYSASSSSYVAALLKYKEDAITIGDETGGGAAGNNGLYYSTVKLPNSKLLIRIPFYWLNYQLIKDQGRGVMPSVPLKYQINDIKEKRDLEMNWLKNKEKQ